MILSASISLIIRAFWTEIHLNYHQEFYPYNFKQKDVFPNYNSQISLQKPNRLQ